MAITSAPSCLRPSTSLWVFVRKVNTSSYHPQTNGGTERVNHTMAQMLTVAVNEQQTDRDMHLPHIEFAYINSVRQANGLAPNDVHIGLSLSVYALHAAYFSVPSLNQSRSHRKG